MSTAALKRATKAQFKRRPKAPSRAELVAAAKALRKLPEEYEKAIAAMKTIVQAQQRIESRQEGRTLCGTPIAPQNVYPEVWCALAMRKLQTELYQVTLGSDGSVTPAKFGTNARGGFAVAIGCTNGAHASAPRVIVGGELPARHELESSTTAELFGTASQAISALKVRQAHGDADSTGALTWAVRNSTSIRPGDLSRSPASGAVEVMILCRELRKDMGHEEMTFGKVKAHVSGLRSDEEVTNEAVDGGSKEAAQGVNVTCEIGGQHGVVGTAVIAIGGDEGYQER
jgi:hypothetical protein